MMMKNQLLEQLILQNELLKGKESHSLGKQVKSWSQISGIAQENPDLTPLLIQAILIADKEPVVGEYRLN